MSGIWKDIIINIELMGIIMLCYPNFSNPILPDYKSKSIREFIGTL